MLIIKFIYLKVESQLEATKAKETSVIMTDAGTSKSSSKLSIKSKASQRSVRSKSGSQASLKSELKLVCYLFIVAPKQN